jgi:two-component system, chemotaxis family, chemotaxis protein CheY
LAALARVAHLFTNQLSRPPEGPNGEQLASSHWVTNSYPAKILVVEDDDAERQSIVELLRLWGYEAHPVPNGREALTALTAGTFDLVLSDQRMPGVSGTELLKALRRLPRFLPCIIISGEESEVQSAMRVGAQAFLEKPVDPRTLRNVVERYVARGPLDEPLSARRGTEVATRGNAAVHDLNESLKAYLKNMINHVVFRNLWRGTR